MRRIALFILSMTLASAAHAQDTYPPLSAARIQAIADERAAAQVATATASTVKPADLDAVKALIPLPANTVPMADMATAGQLGTSPRYRRPDDQAPRISRTVSGTTATGGLGTVTWPTMPAVPKLTVTPYVSATTATQAPLCFPVAGTVTVTGATIKCFTTQTITVSILGAVVAPLTTAASGVQFDVLALPPS